MLYCVSLYEVLAHNDDDLLSDGVVYLNNSYLIELIEQLVYDRVRGPMGKPGPQGPPGPSAVGAVYTRWGNGSCPDVLGTRLVYQGMAGKSAWNNHGGGINYQCFPLDPEYLSSEPGVQSHRAYVYGVEYEIWDEGPLKPLHANGVPCAVCLTYSRGVALMIPGKISCPNIWTHEYHGYLMSERYSHNSPSTFQCIDKDAEPIPESSSPTYGATFEHVESRCPDGSHMCPPYEDGKELACVVCSI